VVTYIATYLSTTLPNTMSVNDLNHDVLVENQVAFASTIATRMTMADAIGGQAILPITLGSQAAPPFAGSDGAQLAPLVNYTGGIYGMFVNYSVTSSSGTTALSAAAVPGAGFDVNLHNTYATGAEVVYDEGAVVYAQPGGIPIMQDPPAISLANSELTVTVPAFLNGFGAESGTGNAELSLRLAVVHSVSLPLGGFTLASGVPVTVTVFTPFAAAWLNFFTNSPSFPGVTTTCTPTATSYLSVCSPSYQYEPGGSLGKVTVSFTVSSLTLREGFFAVGLS
jgi:hypothetical protein